MTKIIPVNPHPEHYKENLRRHRIREIIDPRYYGWQDGFDALRKWLFSPCTEHPTPARDLSTPMRRAVEYADFVYYYLHHKDCPVCMAELETKNKLH